MKEENEMHKPPTSNQPQVVQQRIYGSRPVRPLEGVSNQPEVLSHVRAYGGKSLPIIRVMLEGSDKEMIINEIDFDPAKHSRLD